MTKRMKKADFENENEQEKIMKKRIEQKMETWEVHSLDVWGNAREGWDVNAAYRAGEVEIPTENHWNRNAIFNAIKDEYLTPGSRFSQADFDFSDEGNFFTLLEKKNRKPLFNFVLKESGM